MNLNVDRLVVSEKGEPTAGSVAHFIQRDLRSRRRATHLVLCIIRHEGSDEDAPDCGDPGQRIHNADLGKPVWIMGRQNRKVGEECSDESAEGREGSISAVDDDDQATLRARRRR